MSPNEKVAPEQTKNPPPRSLGSQRRVLSCRWRLGGVEPVRQLVGLVSDMTTRSLNQLQIVAMGNARTRSSSRNTSVPVWSTAPATNLVPNLSRNQRKCLPSEPVGLEPALTSRPTTRPPGSSATTSTSCRPCSSRRWCRRTPNGSRATSGRSCDKIRLSTVRPRRSPSSRMAVASRPAAVIAKPGSTMYRFGIFVSLDSRLLCQAGS